MKLFISYAHTDRWQVNQLVELLRQGKHDPWFDKELTSGFEWQQQLGDAIKQSDVFVYILSPESVGSEWCQWEFARAVEMNKPILPVLIQSKTQFPEAIAKLQYVDFSEGPTPEAVAQLMGGFTQIATTISREAAPQAPTNPIGKPAQLEELERDHVFLSYSTKNVEMMHAVRDKLLAAGISVWTAENIEPGTPLWLDAIGQAIEKAKCIVVFLSPSAKQSTWVKREIDYAEGQNIPIIPVLVDGKKSDAVPFGLSGVQFVDLTADFDRKIEDLIRIIRHELQLDHPEEIKPKPIAEKLVVGNGEALPPTLAPGVGYDAAEGPPDYTIGETGVQYQEAVKRQRQLTIRRALFIGLLVVVGILALGAIMVAYIIVSYNSIASQYTAQIAALANYTPAFQTARILDSQGNTLAEINSEQGTRKRIKLTDVSPELIYALVASENERFYEDPGFDPVAIGRTFLQNLTTGSVASSASSIIQLVANNLILQNEGTPTADGKLREIVVAAEIARTYDKNFILELYLNEVYFGNQVYGVEAAAEFYFRKSAADLDLVEAALLTGLIRSPAGNDPATNPQAAFNSMDQILRRISFVPCLNFQHEPYSSAPFCIPEIVRDNGGFTSNILFDRAMVETRVYFLPDAATFRYPHFVYFVLAQLEREFDADEIFRRGFQIQTTLVPMVQDAAQTALTDMLGQIAFTGVNTGAIMVTDPASGAIRAMIGSPDYNNADINGQVNLALTWQRPGTAIEPIVYTAALEGVGDRNTNGAIDASEYFTPATILWDVPSTYENPAYTPVNFDGRFRGPISVRYALANDINVAAVKAFEFIGRDKFMDTAARLGLTFLQDPPQVTMAAALGATEARLYDMMKAYGTLANNGTYVPLYAIIRIKDADGNAVTMAAPGGPTQRLQREVAFLMQDILSDSDAREDTFGPDSPINIAEYSDNVAVKTGTSSENRDLWTMGFTTNAVVGVWLGRTDNGPTRGSALDHAAPVWKTTMQAVLAILQPPSPFTRPANVFRDDICVTTGSRPDDTCPEPGSELVIVSQPPPTQGFAVTLPIDTWTKLQANEYCTEYVETRTFANISDPFTLAWLGTAAGQPIARQLGLPIPAQPLPPGACNANTTQPVVRISAPASGTPVQGVVPITGVAAAPQDFARYQIDIFPGDAPSEAVMTIGPYINPIPNEAELGRWDTRELPNGSYFIQLTVYSSAQNGGKATRSVQVTVQNPPPTA
jgi:membrane peptidoglycan carboxypeptidase